MDPQYSPFSPAGQIERFQQMAQGINSSAGRTRRMGRRVFLAPFVIGAVGGLGSVLVQLLRWAI